MPELKVDVGLSPPPRQPRGMREGFTTGACATAAALAAVRALRGGMPLEVVTIRLPIGRDVTFALSRCEIAPDHARCGVVKDGGDDPDVTHGAEILASVSWRTQPGIELAGGEGVGTVTRPGLGLEVGGPAINPVPRTMIAEHVAAEMGGELAERGVRVVIAVPRGAELARKTLNGRLGIVGGISILGTTGIVKPWSTASWRASVLQAIDVAAANGQAHIVLSTGGRSERFARRLYPSLQEMAFVEMGEFTGAALERALERGCERATLAGMVGKFSKLAAGHFMTHVAGNQVDMRFLADVAARCGADASVQAEIRAANTARHVQEIALANGLGGLFTALAEMVRERALDLVKGRLAVECIIFDFGGAVLGRAGGPMAEAGRV